MRSISSDPSLVFYATYVLNLGCTLLSPDTLKTLKAQLRPRPILTEPQRWDPKSLLFKAPQVILCVAKVETVEVD